MGKIGYAPDWKPLHTKAYKEFDTKTGEQGKYSKKFDNIEDAMKWLHEDS